MANICPKCMANMDMVGRTHRCTARSVAAEPRVVPTTSSPEDIGPVGKRKHVSTATLTYQYRDQEKRRAYMREYMRKRRTP